MTSLQISNWHWLLSRLLRVYLMPRLHIARQTPPAIAVCGLESAGNLTVQVWITCRLIWWYAINSAMLWRHDYCWSQMFCPVLLSPSLIRWFMAAMYSQLFNRCQEEDRKSPECSVRGTCGWSYSLLLHKRPVCCSRHPVLFVFKV